MCVDQLLLCCYSCRQLLLKERNDLAGKFLLSVSFAALMKSFLFVICAVLFPYVLPSSLTVNLNDVECIIASLMSN